MRGRRSLARSPASSGVRCQVDLERNLAIVVGIVGGARSSEMRQRHGIQREARSRRLRAPSALRPPRRTMNANYATTTRRTRASLLRRGRLRRRARRRRRGAGGDIGDGSRTVTLRVGGMSCASCVAKVEEAAASTPGASSAAVNLLAETATIHVAPTPDAPAADPRDVAAKITAWGFPSEVVDASGLVFRVGGMVCASCPASHRVGHLTAQGRDAGGGELSPREGGGAV